MPRTISIWKEVSTVGVLLESSRVWIAVIIRTLGWREEGWCRGWKPFCFRGYNLFLRSSFKKKKKKDGVLCPLWGFSVTFSKTIDHTFWMPKYLLIAPTVAIAKLPKPPLMLSVKLVPSGLSLEGVPVSYSLSVKELGEHSWPEFSKSDCLAPSQRCTQRSLILLDVSQVSTSFLGVRCQSGACLTGQLWCRMRLPDMFRACHLPTPNKHVLLLSAVQPSACRILVCNHRWNELVWNRVVIWLV